MTTIELDRDTPAAERPTTASLSDTASMTTIGTFAWLGWLWLVVAVAFGLLLVGVAIWGGPDHSIWESFAAGWQRWPIAGSGFTMTIVFTPMFVVNGITRARLAQSAMVAGGVISVCGAVYLTVGFLVERAVFDGNDWAHLGSNERTVTATGFGPILLTYVLIHAAYFVSGWLASIAFNRLGPVFFVPLLPVAALPAAAAELMLSSHGVSRDQYRFLDGADDLSLWVAAPLTLAVVAIAAAIASRYARTLTVR